MTLTCSDDVVDLEALRARPHEGGLLDARLSSSGAVPGASGVTDRRLLDRLFGSFLGEREALLASDLLRFSPADSSRTADGDSDRRLLCCARGRDADLCRLAGRFFSDAIDLPRICDGDVERLTFRFSRARGAGLFHHGEGRRRALSSRSFLVKAKLKEGDLRLSRRQPGRPLTQRSERALCGLYLLRRSSQGCFFAPSELCWA